MIILDIINNFKVVEENINIKDGHYWILLKSDELYKIKNMYVLEEESLNECVNIEQFPKLSFFSGYTFIVFNVLQYKDIEVVSKELNIFLSKDYIITVYKDELNILQSLVDDIRENKNSFILKEKNRTAIILYYILDRIILRNYDVISSLEAYADKIEINILKSPRQEQINQLIHLRRQVYKIRKYLNPLRYIGDSLVSNENNIIEKEDIVYFKNLNLKIEKLMLSLEGLVQDLALVREAFESEISNKTNDIMKVFSIVASIFLPLNLISSMYGMNFKNIPFVEHENGYYIISFAMVLISLGLLFLFKKKKWL
ncbi:magnesium transporter CorA family protein [Candidatus Clostridium radicumherbarum]|uniref:Magnesium transporter CorA family protein n=1 Tax=Candidatus Clostridium radicumherbarum TaxID=3381662 RepID=A0ABW8TT93_9CLOT